jgi:hypothetical protein
MRAMKEFDCHLNLELQFLILFRNQVTILKLGQLPGHFRMGYHFTMRQSSEDSAVRGGSFVCLAQSVLLLSFSVVCNSAFFMAFAYVGLSEMWILVCMRVPLSRNSSSVRHFSDISTFYGTIFVISALVCHVSKVASYSSGWTMLAESKNSHL